MLTVEELWALIDREVRALPDVRDGLEKALGRRLVEAVRADADLPAFSRSAIDGFAVAAGSRPGNFRVIGEVRPGSPAASPPGPGEAWRIFTGSALPDEGVELVMVEDTRSEGDSVTVLAAPSPDLIRFRGSQAREGQILLPEGAMVSAGTLALLASVGTTEPFLSPVPRAAHLTTGSELVPAEQIPGAGFIRDSNTPLVAGLLAETGADRVFHAHVTESVEDAVDALAGVEADLYLISGGASVGAYDGAAEILRRLGFIIHSDKVKSRPGKPLIFATRGPQVAFGLPGNPLSHFVCFQLFVRRALARLSGRPSAALAVVQVLGDPPAPDPRETWWPALVASREGRLVAQPLPWQDSSDLIGLAQANALLRIASAGIDGSTEALLFGELTG